METVDGEDVIRESVAKSLKIPSDLFLCKHDGSNLSADLKVCDSTLSDGETVQITFDMKLALFKESCKIIPNLDYTDSGLKYKLAVRISEEKRWTGAMLPLLELIKLIQEEQGLLSDSEHGSYSESESEYDSDGNKKRKDNGIYLEFVNEDVFSDLLVYFSKKGKIDFIRVLANYTKIDSRDKKGDTALLCHMVHGRDVRMVSALLDLGADINAATHRNNDTAIIFASYKGYIEIAEELIKRGADLNVVTVRGSTALGLAIKNEHFEIVESLLDAGAGATIGSFDPLYYASLGGHEELTMRILDLGADVGKKYGINQDTVLSIAAYNGYLEIVRELIKRGAKDCLLKSGYTALSLAVSEGYIEICKELIESGSNIDAGGPPICFAAKRRNVELFLLLLESGADINALDKNGSNSLVHASNVGCLKIVKESLNRCSHIDDEMCEKSIDAAISNRHSEVILEILNRCPGIKLSEDRVKKLLNKMIIEDMADAAEKWIDMHPDIDYYKDVSFPGLMTHEKVKILNKIFYNKGEANGKLGEKTILMFAAERGDSKFVQELMYKGAKRDRLDNNGWSALTYALTYGHENLVRYLK